MRTKTKTGLDVLDQDLTKLGWKFVTRDNENRTDFYTRNGKESDEAIMIYTGEPKVARGTVKLGEEWKEKLLKNLLRPEYWFAFHHFEYGQTVMEAHISQENLQMGMMHACAENTTQLLDCSLWADEN